MTEQQQYPITVTFFYLYPRPMKTLKCFLSLEICLFWAFCISCYCSVAQLCLTLQSHGLQNARLPRLPFTISQSLLKLTYIELVMPSNHLVLCCPLLILPSIFPSIRVISNESVLPIRWPKYWNFSSSISPSNEYSGLIPFRFDWFDLLEVHGTF